ncbi:MAG TPA: hypothetical protein VMC81_03885 [Rhodocyclaceae bacterium]|nr:hypothetical protein [Rhodocyclaceae bacterium]
MNEKLFHRLLRTAAWITVAGVVMGTSLEWTAVMRARQAADALERERLLDSALGVAVFWAMLWISLPIGAIAFWRHIGWLERIPALFLPAVAIAGIVTALLMR